LLSRHAEERVLVWLRGGDGGVIKDEGPRDILAIVYIIIYNTYIIMVMVMVVVWYWWGRWGSGVNIFI
jgi:hypothetical protein